MSIELHELSDVDYNALRYEIIANIEGEKNHAYIDSEGYVTIGAGFNMHGSGVRDDVLQEFFEINEENSPEIYQQLVDIFSQQYEVDARGNPLPGETERLNNALNAVMETWAQGGDDRPSTFVIGDAGGQTWQQRVRAFFENNFSQEYEDKVTDFIQNHPVMLENMTALVLPNSKERAALFSLAYNQRDNNWPLLREGLGNALEIGDRRAAWFEIRYASNFSNVNGVAKQRFYEPQVYGLYNYGEGKESLLAH